MPFIRHARDKRGYESTFVMHAYRGSNGASRTRVLYLFRSPSSLKVGRRALEPEVMEALEHTHPDLAFDWTTLLREPGLPRMDPRERQPRASRSGGRPDAARLRQAAEPAPAILEDESLLGRTLGAREAARLRGRYNDLVQRIARRARTPEDRDRLMERAVRLNPDEWADQAAIQAGAATVEADWDALSNELPHRRRGRRGGRGRSEAQSAVAEASGIINETTAKGDPNDDPTQGLETGFSGRSAFVDSAGDGTRLGPDAESAGEQPDAGADINPPGDPDVPGGGGHHSD